jgi:HD-like signal output (HDOD) protein
MNLPTKEQFSAAITKIDRLYPAPRTLARAMQLLKDPDSGLQEIASLISSDSALAVDVLRCANSAYYGRETDIGDVGEAVQVVGSRETMELVSLVAARQAAHQSLTSYGITAEDSWAESLFSGLFLEKLTASIDGLESGESYTAGLVRFIGRLAIEQVLRDFGGGVSWDHVTPLADWERQTVGLTQAEVGGRLLRKWNFPERIIGAVEAQDLSGADILSAEPFVQALHFLAQILPAGTTLAAIDAMAASPVSIPKNHPFAVTSASTSEATTQLLREAHRAFVAIRGTLYR